MFTLLVVLLIAGTTMPGAVKVQIEGHMWRKVPWSTLAHYTLFALIALCRVYGAGRAAVWRTVLVGLSLAVLTELLQAMVPGRHPQLRDIAIDLSGTVTAVVLLRVLAPTHSAR